MSFFSASGKMNWYYWKWHFLCVTLHPFLFMYMVLLELLRYLLCQEWIHRVAYPVVTWLASVQLSWKWIRSIIFLSISDSARAYSRRVLSRWSKYINCDQLLLHITLATLGRDGTHTSSALRRTGHIVLICRSPLPEAEMIVHLHLPSS